MNNIMQYKGYIGSVEFSEEDEVFYGKVLGIRSLISYEGTNAKELINDFHNAVDDYLAMCKENNTEPEKAYKGSFKLSLYKGNTLRYLELLVKQLIKKMQNLMR